MLNWRDSLKEGPTKYPDKTVIVPGYTSCGLCKYYEHKMIRSGRDPIYDHNCVHPDVRSGGSFRGNLESHDSVVHTPNWCPFLKA